MIDICVTGLIRHSDPYQTNFGSQKWSTVIGLGFFDRIHNIAKTAFEYMDAQGHYVPEIDRRGLHGITMAWTDEERIATIILEPGKFSYRWGNQGVSLPTYTNEIEKLTQILDLFSKYLNRTIEVTHDAVGGNAVQDGSGSGQEGGSSPMGPAQHRGFDRDCGCCK